MNTDETQILSTKGCPLPPSIHEAQLLNELRSMGFKVGYLINFGRERVEYKRMVF